MPFRTKSVHVSPNISPNISPFGLIWALWVLFLCFGHLIKSAPWWPITKSATWTLGIPIRTNSAKSKPIWTNKVPESAIFVFQSLNKLSPLVADYKIGSANPAYTLQDQLCQIWAHLAHLKIYFSCKNPNCAYPLSNAALKKWRPSLRSGLKND